MPAEIKPLHLNLPEIPPAHFDRNFITQVICEMRFPILFDLDKDKPPASFVSQLRKSYPVYELHQEVKVGLAGGNSHSAVHIFRGRNGWSITLRPSSLVLETLRYESFEKFSEQLDSLIRIAAPVIDSDFFTRVGLRYTNAIPFQAGEIDGWINPHLVKPLASGLFGQPQEFSGRIGGTTADGGFLFSHGIGESSPSKGLAYILDFDLFKEDVLVDEAMRLVRKLHEYEFSMFSWAIGEKARAHLGPSRK